MKRRDAHTAASEVVRACCALKGTNSCPTILIVASEAARTEASVATEVVAVGEHFLEGREVVPVAGVVVHTTTSHGVPTVRGSVDNASVVRGCSPSGTLELVAMHVVVAMAAEDHTKAAAGCPHAVSTPAQVTVGAAVVVTMCVTLGAVRLVVGDKHVCAPVEALDDRTSVDVVCCDVVVSRLAVPAAVAANAASVGADVVGWVANTVGVSTVGDGIATDGHAGAIARLPAVLLLALRGGLLVGALLVGALLVVALPGVALLGLALLGGLLLDAALVPVVGVAVALAGPP